MAPKREPLDDEHFEELIRYGIASVKGGDREQARRWLNKALLIKYSDARPWLWLSATTDDPGERRQYLERAVAAEPSNAAARRGLAILLGKIDPSRLIPEGSQVAPRHPQEPEEVEGRAYQCPRCGVQVGFEVRDERLTCPYCGYQEAIEQKPLGDDAEQPVDFILPTRRAHLWAEARQRLSCERCGAVTLLPPEQRADRCPYCGSNRLVTTVESQELIEPQAIVIMKVGEKQALSQVKRWLVQSWFVPDDLVAHAHRLKLRPAYYPFWTFDGTLELNWRCEVNQGTSRNPRWASRSGAEFEFFDDVLVPGLRAISMAEIASVEPFELKEAMVFQPEFLAGWVALGYDLPLSEASLLAREKVISILRKSLVNRIEPGLEKRNINSGGGKWSGQTYKYLLLPLWVGTYTYRGREYRLLVNGESGKVGGKKPRDPIKVWFVAVGAVVLLLILVLIFYLLFLNFGSSLNPT